MGKREKGNKVDNFSELAGVGLMIAGIWKAFESFGGYLSKNDEEKIWEQAEDFFNKGINFRIKMRDKEALECFLECLKKVPNHVDALNSIAEIYVFQGVNFIQAEEFIHRALVFSNSLEDKIECLENLAFLHEEEEQYEKAIFRYKEIIGLIDKNNEDYWVYLHDIGGCYEELKQWDEALNYYLASKKTGNDKIYLLRDLAAVYNKKEDYDKAKMLYKKYLLGIPSQKNNSMHRFNYFDGYFGLGECYKMTGELGKAIESFEKAVNYHKEDPEAYFHLSIIYAKLGNLQKMNENINGAAALIKEDEIKEYQDYINNIKNDKHFYLDEGRKKIMLNTFLNTGFIGEDEYQFRMNNLGTLALDNESVLEVQNLIKKAKTEQAIECLLKVTVHRNRELYKQVILISGEATKLRNETRMGTIKSEDETVGTNRIHNKLLSILDELKN